MQRLAVLCFLLAIAPGAGEGTSEVEAAQLRGSGRAEASDATALVQSESGNACTSGLVGKLRDHSASAKACVDACSGSCGALGQAINAYLRQGGKPAAKRSVCAHAGSFRCYVTGSAAGKCASLISEAAKFGFSLPSSESDLNHQCGHSAAALEAETEQAATPSEELSVAETAQPAAADAAAKVTLDDEAHVHAVMAGMAAANETELTLLSASGGCYADQGTLRTCGTSCFSKHPRDTCISGCLHGAGISRGCSSCLGEKSDCSIKHCLNPCAASATGEKCKQCVRSHCKSCR